MTNAQVQNKDATVRYESASLEKRKTAMVNARRLSFTNDKNVYENVLKHANSVEKLFLEMEPLSRYSIDAR